MNVPMHRKRTHSMTNISKKNIVAAMLVYGIARGVIEEVKPTAEGEESTATDTTVFEETIKAFNNKEVEVNNGK